MGDLDFLILSKQVAPTNNHLSALSHAERCRVTGMPYDPADDMLVQVLGVYLISHPEEPEIRVLMRAYHDTFTLLLRAQSKANRAWREHEVEQYADAETEHAQLLRLYGSCMDKIAELLKRLMAPMEAQLLEKRVQNVMAGALEIAMTRV